MLKSTAWLLVLTLMVSCNNKKEEPVVTTNGKNDSSKIVRPGRAVNPYSTVDVSPMDMSYFPAEYPKLKMSKAIQTAPLARVVYSRPHLEGRVLFQDLLHYEENWRLGANEATELELYKDATIQGKQIKAGRYIMYCIPHPDNWTIVLNSNIDTWGLEQDGTKDIARFTVPVKKTNQRIEYYTMVFEKTPAGADLLMAWDALEVRLPLQF